MPADEVIRQRLHLLEEYIQKLQNFLPATPDEMAGNTALVWAVEHGLQLSIQCVIDVCQYLVADLALGTPATSQDAVDLLQAAGVFPREFADTVLQMIRFRNILVHVYSRVDVNLVYENLQNRLDDFGHFARYVLDFLASRSGK